MTRRTRGLTPEERALWQAVSAAVRPIHPARRKAVPKPTNGPGTAPREASRDPPAPIPPFRLGENATDPPAGPKLLQSVRGSAAETPLWMDRAVFREMARGKAAPEARIDLHGMTVAEAHIHLTAFLFRSHQRGLRLVLVITGKGRAGDGGGTLQGNPSRGALRRQVPHWLAMAPLAPMILQSVPAHRRHGGEGAFYVYLRRAKG
ncbi:MAG: Smr/MutS family protein [Paracoccaceae bacterium]